MACDEIDKAFAWAKQTSAHEQFLVKAFFTKHQGVLTEPNTPQVGRGADYCWYAVGEVTLSAAGHLVGDLQLYAVSSSPSERYRCDHDGYGWDGRRGHLPRRGNRQLRTEAQR